MSSSQLSTLNSQLRAAAPRYIELRARSAFSFLAGASLPEDLVAAAAALGYSAIALGDRDGVYGAPRFHQAAQRAGVRALVGADLTCALGPTACSLYVLAASRTGYQNLCQLLTHSKLRAPKGESVVLWEDLEGHTDGLICLAGGAEGPVAAALRSGPSAPPLPRSPAPRLSLLIARLQSLFPDRLYLDLQRHLDVEEERLNRLLLAVAEQFRLPVVATNDVRHAQPSGRRLLDVLTCIAHKTTLDAAGRQLLRNAERHLKAPAEMVALFRDQPQALANTQRIAEQCEFTLANLGYRFPDYPLPPGETPMSYLRVLTEAGAQARYGSLTPRVRQQLEHEFAIIDKLGLAGYFLIVWDIIRFCREQRILAQGRGSAANSAVCYALGITAVDAVGMELLFERFLSEERGEWPDIDIDLPSGDQRERVIQYVYQRYGERGAAMTANVISYRTRSAVREVGKALGFSLEQVDRLSKLLRRFEFIDASDDLAVQLKAGGVDAAAPRVRWLVELVRQIQHLPRHLGQHSGGMVIAAGRLDAVVPLEPASMPGRVVVQWDKDDCADLGIIKVDLLGLGMMAVLEESIPLIREHEGKEIDLAHLPQDDPTVYGMLQRADTIGVFQVESRAQMATLPRLKPERFYDLVVEVAIIRPGPIVGQMVHPYLNRRSGRAAVTYAHPDLEPILKRTLGVPLFQEQLLRMAMTLAGFTGGEAEELRRAMGFKRSVERMQQIETRLRSGMARRGITGSKADDIVRSITSFALYGFPESHAASFALLAYASAYLRAHHIGAFTCAMLNNWPMGFYHPATLVKDAQRHGLRVLPIDINCSGWKCGLEFQTDSDPSPPSPAGTVDFLELTHIEGKISSPALLAGEDEGEGSILTDRLGILRSDASLQDSEPSPRPSPAGDAGEGKSNSVWGHQRSEPRKSEHRTQTGSEGELCLRLGLRYVIGLREAAARRIEAERAHAPFVSIADVAARCALRDSELETLAHIGAFAAFGVTRRAALWQAAAVPHEPLLAQRAVHGPWSTVHGSQKAVHGPRSTVHSSQKEGLGNASTVDAPLPAQRAVHGPRSTVHGSQKEGLGNASTVDAPLPEMSALDRTLADYRGTGMTVGPQVMQHLRAEMERQGVRRAKDVPRARDGSWAKIAGLVIVRQRPGTAKGFCFITLEDETGTANAVVLPNMFQQYRSVIHTAAFLLIEGPLQKVDGVIHVRARRIQALSIPQQHVGLTGSGYRMRVAPQDEAPPTPKSHDFR